jgi:HD superfamily phosphohydrolase
MRDSETIHIRDPIHGTLPVSPRELRVIDHPMFQRLRNIKQLGFADLSFPGATHSRYSHSLGAMRVATRLFDRVFEQEDLPERVRSRFRQAVRLAMMLHDIGHAPLSHTTEMLMPPVGELGLGVFAGDDVARRASHEDYTLKMVLDSALGETIAEVFGDDGIMPPDVAELIAGQTWKHRSTRFRHGGTDYSPVLRQIVSSEMDADRMDYLQRDSFYSGVMYGKFDADWLIDNVTPVSLDDSVYMGLKARAVFSFEDFLLSRYHMFATVYLHHTPVIFEKMLSKYFESSDGEFILPADTEKYAQLDDTELWHVLRRSKNPWARRIVERQPFRMIDERQISSEGYDGEMPTFDALCDRLEDEGVEHIATRSRSVLSKYFETADKNPIFVVTGQGRAISLEEYTPLYLRYNTPALFARVFVHPEQRKKAKEILAAVEEEKAAAVEPTAPEAEA